MDAAAKGLRAHEGAFDVQRFGISIDVWVSIGGAQQRDHHLARLKPLSGHFHALLHHAGQLLHGRIEAQELLHRLREQGRLGLEALELRRVAVQGDQGIADQVHGGLVAGHEQEPHVLREFLVGEGALLVFGAHQVCGQVVAGGVALEFGQLPQVGVELFAGRGRLLAAGFGVEIWVYAGAPADDLVGEEAEMFPIFVRDAQHVGDDRGRNRVGVIPRYIHFAACRQLVEQVIHQPLHRGPHPGHALGVERLGDQPPQPRVIGRIDVQHVVRFPLVVRPVGRHPVFRARRWLLAEAAILQDEVDVLITGGVPDAIALHQPRLADERVSAVGVLEERLQILLGEHGAARTARMRCGHIRQHPWVRARGLGALAMRVATPRQQATLGNPRWMPPLRC